MPSLYRTASAGVSVAFLIILLVALAGYKPYNRTAPPALPARFTLHAQVYEGSLSGPHHTVTWTCTKRAGNTGHRAKGAAVIYCTPARESRLPAMADGIHLGQAYSELRYEHYLTEPEAIKALHIAADKGAYEDGRVRIVRTAHYPETLTFNVTFVPEAACVK